MEGIVVNHLYNHFYTNNLILYKYQSGFIPGHSTTFQLVDIYHHFCQNKTRAFHPLSVNKVLNGNRNLSDDDSSMIRGRSNCPS